MTEMGLDGEARVLAIDPCPEIEPDDGAGRMIVTGTMRHLAANVLEVVIAGETEPLGVTDTHPIWSEDRHDFVVAKQLRTGERLRQSNGTLTQVTRITPKRGPPVLVYNLEIDGEHVYHVGHNGLLVHNACPLYHGTDSVSADDILKNGLNPVKLKAAPDPDTRGFFLTPNRHDAEDYARLRAHERGGNPVVLQVDRAKVKRVLDDVPNAIGGEKMIPISQFGSVPIGIFQVAE